MVFISRLTYASITPVIIGSIYPPINNIIQIKNIIFRKSVQTGTNKAQIIQIIAEKVHDGTANGDFSPPILLPIIPLEIAPRIGAVILVTANHKCACASDILITTTK